MHSTARAVSIVVFAACSCVLGYLEPTPDFGETLSDATGAASTTAPAATNATTSATSSSATGSTTGTTSATTTGSATTDAATTMAAPCAGACDPVLELCNEERDICECRPGLDRCGDLCINLANDQGHCGACDMACQNPQTCGESECHGPQCPDTLDKCGKSCVDHQTDPLHCGGCDSPCLAAQSCVDGQCVD